MDISWLFFTSILTAHLLVDFVCQTDKQAEKKHEINLKTHILHAIQHAAFAFALAGYWTCWSILFVIPLSHFVIDFARERAARSFVQRDSGDERQGNGIASSVQLWILVVNQALHILVIFALVRWLAPQTADGYWHQTIGEVWTSILVIACGAIVTIFVGGVVIGILTTPYVTKLHRQVDSAADRDEIRPQAQNPRGFPSGGRLIGQLERLLIFLLLLQNQYTAVGFLVAAKSIFRFGELNDPAVRMESEYIIIGTMMSFAWAIISSWATGQILIAVAC